MTGSAEAADGVRELEGHVVVIDVDRLAMSRYEACSAVADVKIGVGEKLPLLLYST